MSRIASYCRVVNRIYHILQQLLAQKWYICKRQTHQTQFWTLSFWWLIAICTSVSIQTLSKVSNGELMDHAHGTGFLSSVSVYKWHDVPNSVLVYWLTHVREITNKMPRSGVCISQGDIHTYMHYLIGFIAVWGMMKTGVIEQKHSSHFIEG